MLRNNLDIYIHQWLKEHRVSFYSDATDKTTHFELYCSNLYAAIQLEYADETPYLMTCYICFEEGDNDTLYEVEHNMAGVEEAVIDAVLKDFLNEIKEATIIQKEAQKLLNQLKEFCRKNRININKLDTTDEDTDY